MKKIYIPLIVSFFAGSAFSDNRTFVLSGGGNPYSNHYSQYLQTRTLTDGLRLIPGAGQVEVRFGAGNSDKEPHLLPDVHRIRMVNGSPVRDFIHGVISGNRPGTKQEVARYFQSLSGLTSQDTFYLFVSDHGMPSRRDFVDNCIDLWDYDPQAQLFGRSLENRCLSTSELKGYLSSLPAKRSVFVMSQCFSGGFHQMSVTQKDGYPTANPKICGFTATTEDQTASGCTPNVDGPNYKGYERFFTQQFTGKDVVTGNPLPYSAKHTLKQAHVAAALEDTTKDMPMSTSDYFLVSWVNRILKEGFAPRTPSASAATVENLVLELLSGRIPQEKALSLDESLSKLWQEKVDYLEKTIALLSSSHPNQETLFRKGDRKDLLNEMDEAHSLGQAELRDNIRRVYIARQALAGIAALSSMKDETAIRDLRGLLDCESAAL